MKSYDPSIPAPSILCADTWPRDKLKSPQMQAYKTVEKTGTIRILQVRYSRATARVTIEYLSTVPIQWARDLLRQAVPPPPDPVQEQMEL